VHDWIVGARVLGIVIKYTEHRTGFPQRETGTVSAMDARMDSMSRTRASTSVALEQQVRSSGPAQQRPGTGHKGPHSKKPAAKPLPKKPILLGMDLGTEYS
jgi:hypothetical protein